MLSSGLCASVPAAVLGSLAMGAGYVACLYIGANYRRSRGRAPDRDDPRVVKERFVRVGVACAVAPCLSIMSASLSTSKTHTCSPQASLWRWFGLSTPNMFLAVTMPLVLTMILFFGPLVMAWLERDHVSPLHVMVRDKIRELESGGLFSVRNLVVGPVTEEWVFRACMCPLLFGAGLSDVSNVFLSAFIFGSAHIHHVFDADVDYAVILVQFTYTFLFGAYSSYLFLRTGHLLGPILAHAFCNSQGLPAFGRVPGHPHRRVVAGSFVLGLGAFTTLVTLDAIYRPALFGSMFWK